MQRSRLKNIINKSKGLSKQTGDPFDLFVNSLPEGLDYYKGDNYRLKAAWKAYGSPKNYQEALWEGLIQPIDENTFKMPSIGYNEENDSYEYLNKGKENDIVAKDIRVWDNDVIPFVKELKHGGYVRTFNEEKDCWTYSKNTQKRIESPEDNEQQINKFQEGGKSSTPELNSKETGEEPVGYMKDGTPLFVKGDGSIGPISKLGEDNLFELIEKSDANFAKRLKDPNRKKLKLADGEWGNFKLAWSEDETGVIVYPEIQEIDGKLVDLSSDREKAWESAVKRGDYVYFPSKEAADWFTKNYKKYYKGFKEPQAFKQGGQMSVIPEGALHARKNNMEGAGEDFTAKGIPVVDNKGEQQAEIERDEIIFRKQVTEKMEQLYKKYNSEESPSKKDEIAIEMGKIITCEITKHTDDKTGLIDKIQNQ